MKQFLAILISIICISVSSQEIDKNIYKLTQKVNKSKNTEKLKWLDSLSTYIRENTNFQSDSIAKETFHYALKHDSMRVATKNMAYLIYYQNNITGDLKEGKRLFLNFLSKAKKSGNHKILSKFYLEGADNYFYLEDQKTAIEFYILSEKEAVLAGDELQVGLAKMYKGNALSFIGEFSEASKEFQDALQIFQKLNNVHYIISARSSLSDLYSQNLFYDQAKKERNEAILLAERVGSHGHLSAFYYNAALDNQSQGDYKGSIENFKKALNAGRKTNNPKFYEATPLTGLVIAYCEINEIKQAEFYLKEFEKIYKGRLEHVKELHLDALMHLAFAKKNYPLALKYGKEYLNSKSNGTNFQNIQYAELFMSKAYEAMGDTDQAYKHFKIHSEIKDSIGKIKKVNALSYYQTLYETNKRDLKIKEQENNIILLDAKNKLYNQLLLFGGFGLILIFGIILLARSRNAAKRMQKMQIAFSHDLINAQEEEKMRIARELHDSVGQKVMLLTRQSKKYDDQNMQSLATNTLEELRSISRGLHPATLDKLGLTSAILAMINEVDAHTDTFFTNEIENIDPYMSKEASLHLYRIFQELLNNIVKHAEAKVVSVNIELDKNNIEVIVKDDGKGFEQHDKLKSETSLGMRTLMERARILNSTLEIKSKPNFGTIVILLIPFENV